MALLGLLAIALEAAALMIGGSGWRAKRRGRPLR